MLGRRFFIQLHVISLHGKVGVLFCFVFFLAAPATKHTSQSPLCVFDLRLLS